MSPLYDRIADQVGAGGLTTCAIADALDALGVPDRILHHGLRRVDAGGGMFFGSAYPVSWTATRKTRDIRAASPGTWSEVRDFLVPDLSDGRGLVYVAGAGGLVVDAALAGGLSITYFQRQLGLEGVVLGGAVRDRAQVLEAGIPVVASNFIPTDTQGAYRVASVGEECVIANVVVKRGDWVFSDDNGTAVVPHAHVENVLRVATEVESREARVLTGIEDGRRLPDMIDGGAPI